MDLPAGRAAHWPHRSPEVSALITPRRAPALLLAALLTLGPGTLLAQGGPPAAVNSAAINPAAPGPSNSSPATPGPATLTLTLGGPDTVVLGVPARLSLTRRAGSLTLSGGSGVSWSSSAPQVLAVDASGGLTALRLSAAPVIITASSGGTSVRRAVSSAGLELTLGTFNFSPGTPGARLGVAALLRLRLPPGVTFPGSDSLRAEVMGPVGRLPAGLDPAPDGGNPQERSGWSADPGRAALPGHYRAELTLGGVRYRAEATLTPQEATRAMPPLLEPALGVRGGSYTLSGTAAQPGQYAQAALFSALRTSLAPALAARALPASGQFPAAPAAGHYTQGVFTLGGAPFPAAGEVTPTRFDMAWTDLGEIDVP